MIERDGSGLRLRREHPVEGGRDVTPAERKPGRGLHERLRLPVLLENNATVLEAFCRRVSRALPARRVRGKVAAPRLLVATAGADAAALGVAALPIDEFLAPTPQVLLKPSVRPPSAGLGAPRAAALAQLPNVFPAARPAHA